MAQGGHAERQEDRAAPAEAGEEEAGKGGETEGREVEEGQGSAC